MYTEPLRNAINQFLRKPRTTRLRRIVFQLHVWLGVLVALYGLLMGLSGSLMTGYSAFRRHAFANRAVEPAITADRAAEIARQASEGGRLTGLTLPAGADRPYRAFIRRKAQTSTVEIDAQTGAVSRSQTDFLHWVERFHSNFWLGRTGRLWVGIGGLVILAMCLTGVIIWWPGLNSWKRGFAIHAGAGWKRLIWDLHSVVGIAAVLFIFLSALTGAYFTWPQVYRSAVSLLGRISPPSTPPSVQPAPRPASLAQLIRQAEAALPGKHVFHLAFPDRPDRALRLFLSGDLNPSPNGADSVWIDPYTAQILRIDRAADRPAGDRLLAAIAAIHFGDFGGRTSLLLWTLLGLSLPLLAVTGILMWWNRWLRKRWIAVNDYQPAVSCQANGMSEESPAAQRQ